MAKVPETADGYAFKLSDEAQKLVGDLTDDPLMKSIREHAAAEKWTQGQFNAVAAALEVAAKTGVLTPAIDVKAEQAALGDRGEARMREAETYLNAIKTRGEIDDGMFGELMLLTQTASGVKAFEYLKSRMGPDKVMDPPAEGAALSEQEQKQKQARDMQADPKYKSDPAFRRQADKFYMEAFA